MKKLAIIAFTAFGLAACGAGRKNAAEAAKAVAADPDLQGSWQSESCTPGGVTLGMTGPNAGLSHRVEYIFEKNEATRKTVAYSSVNCAGETFRYEEVGTFYPETDKSKWTNDGERPIKIVWDKLQVTPVGKDSVDLANKGLCGKQNGWQDGKSQDVTANAKDLTCYAQSIPRTEFNIYKVNTNVKPNTVQLGKNITSDSKEQDRPAKATGPIYTKH